MHGDQSRNGMPMPGQHNVLAGLGPANQISQSCFCFCDGKLHGLSLIPGIRLDHLMVYNQRDNRLRSRSASARTRVVARRLGSTSDAHGVA